MTYDYDQHTTDGEQHIATARLLEQNGFTIHQAPTGTDLGDHHDDLDELFGGPDIIETREGCERTLRAIRLDLEDGHV